MQKHNSVLEQEKDDYRVASDLGSDLTTTTYDRYSRCLFVT